jgi:hypothetical protein
MDIDQDAQEKTTPRGPHLTMTAQTYENTKSQAKTPLRMPIPRATSPPSLSCLREPVKRTLPTPTPTSNPSTPSMHKLKELRRDKPAPRKVAQHLPWDRHASQTNIPTSHREPPQLPIDRPASSRKRVHSPPPRLQQERRVHKPAMRKLARVPHHYTPLM